MLRRAAQVDCLTGCHAFFAAKVDVCVVAVNAEADWAQAAVFVCGQMAASARFDGVHLCTLPFWSKLYRVSREERRNAYTPHSKAMIKIVSMCPMAEAPEKEERCRPSETLHVARAFPLTRPAKDHAERLQSGCR